MEIFKNLKSKIEEITRQQRIKNEKATLDLLNAKQKLDDEKAALDEFIRTAPEREEARLNKIREETAKKSAAATPLAVEVETELILRKSSQ